MSHSVDHRFSHAASSMDRHVNATLLSVALVHGGAALSRRRSRDEAI